MYLSECLFSKTLRKTAIFVSGGVFQLAQGFSFNLADAFPRDRELLTHLFQRVISVHPNAKPHPQHPFFTRGE